MNFTEEMAQDLKLKLDEFDKEQKEKAAASEGAGEVTKEESQKAECDMPDGGTQSDSKLAESGGEAPEAPKESSDKPETTKDGKDVDIELAPKEEAKEKASDEKVPPAETSEPPAESEEKPQET